MFFEVTECCKF